MKRKNVKEKKMMPRHKMLIDALDRLEQCKYSPLDISWCIDTYIWMVKWKKIDAAEKERLAEQILRIQEMQKFLREHEWKVST
jgi:hypothetical protein